MLYFEPSSELRSNSDQNSSLCMHVHKSRNRHDRPRHHTSSITSLSKQTKSRQQNYFSKQRIRILISYNKITALMT